MTTKHEKRLIDLTATIVAAYVGNNTIAADDVPALIAQTHGALLRVSANAGPDSLAEPRPAVPVESSITPGYLVCLEDGRQFKSLKRHLRAQYNMSPEQYREKWGLPPDYPMVAPEYAHTRSQLARKMGLGQPGKRGK